ncbi:MAG: hypothetical protein ACRYFA_07160 [Janthinobacterium lividum]
MKKLLLALLLLCLFCTCKKDPYANICGGKNPIENLPWLKAEIDTLQKSNYQYIIKRGIYQNKTIFSESIICALCNSIILYYDCDGNEIHLTSEQYNYLLNNSFPNAETIWKN